jgi:hypothetical protein
VPGIEAIEITAKLRQKLVPLPEGSTYLGFISRVATRHNTSKLRYGKLTASCAS